MAKKKGGARPPRNLNLIGKGEKQTQQQIIDKGKSERGLNQVEKQNLRKTGDKDKIPENSKQNVERYRKEAQKHVKESDSKIILKNKIEEAKKQPQKEPDKAKEPQKTKQHDIEKDKE